MNHYYYKYLESQQEQESLHRVVSSVDEIAHEQVIRLGNIAANFKQFFEIVKLPMNVSANLRNGKTKEKKEKCESRRTTLFWCINTMMMMNLP